MSKGLNVGSKVTTWIHNKVFKYVMKIALVFDDSIRLLCEYFERKTMNFTRIEVTIQGK